MVQNFTDPKERISLDSRYEKIGWQITQYDLQRQNGVLNILESYIHYTASVFPGSSIKKNIMMDVYVRQSIPWSLECEHSNVASRQEAQEFFRTADIDPARKFSDQVWKYGAAAIGICSALCCFGGAGKLWPLIAWALCLISGCVMIPILA